MQTKQTAEIFEILRRGQFICSNSPDGNMQSLYRILEDEEVFEELADYFSHINYSLEKGNEFFYFSRPVPKRDDLERKLDKAFDWIDLLDFFKTYDSSFDVGYRFSPSEIDAQLKNNADLKTKLEDLKPGGVDRRNYLDRIRKAVDKLEKDGYIKLENESTETYKVLTSFTYLKELITSITIPEETANEIPE
jgi:hypothetical protein